MLLVASSPICTIETAPDEKPIEMVVYEQPSIHDAKEITFQSALDDIEHITDEQTWYIEYKKIIEEFSPWLDSPETIYDVYTAEDIRYMLKCIETETYQQSFISKVNVASVILNRVNSELFPSKPIDVVTSPKQFAYFRENIAEDTVLALEYAYMIEDTTDGALFFHSFETAPPTFSNANYIFTDEAGHHFYK